MNSRLDLLNQQVIFLKEVIEQLETSKNNLEIKQAETILIVERLTMKVLALENSQKMFVGWLSSLSMALLIEILLKRLN